MITFSDIQDAYLFVSSAPYGDHSAVLRMDTGQILYSSEMGGIDEIEDADLDGEQCIEIPHKNDLDLGKALVFDFVETHMADAYDDVRQMFRSQGAYSRFKRMLESKGLLESWYDFEQRREEEALRDWCRDNKIELSE
jgi:hypothetical protein